MLRRKAWVSQVWRGPDGANELAATKVQGVSSRTYGRPSRAERPPVRQSADANPSVPSRGFNRPEVVTLSDRTSWRWAANSSPPACGLFSQLGAVPVAVSCGILRAWPRAGSTRPQPHSARVAYEADQSNCKSG